MNQGIDQIFAKSNSKVADFEFNEQVAQVFPDMIKRSVPGYLQMLQGIGDIANLVVTPNSHIYDLGCSLGAVSLSVRRHVEDRPCSIFGIDNSPAMLEQAKMRINSFKSSHPIRLIHQDIQECSIENASLVVLNFTLQFLPQADRQALIQKIYQGLLPNGVLIVSEKLRFQSEDVSHLMERLHLDFKRSNGYSELEISQKRAAIEHVMKPDYIVQHAERFQKASFKNFSTWFQCFNFASMVAIK